MCVDVHVSASYLGSEVDGEDGRGLGGPVGAVVVVVVSPLLLLPPEQILVAQRDTAVILMEDRSGYLEHFN